MTKTVAIPTTININPTPMFSIIFSVINSTYYTHGEDGPVVGTIQLGGFFQLGRQGFKVGAHVDEVEHRHQAGQQDGNAAVQQAQIPDYQIGGDHAAVEEHGKGDKDGERLFEQQVFAGQGVGQHGREDHVECGAHDGIKNGVQQPVPDFGVGKYPFIGI